MPFIWFLCAVPLALGYLQGEIRLTGANRTRMNIPDDVHAGRVEVHYNGTWGTVCDDMFDSRALWVVCRQLSRQLGLDLYPELWLSGPNGNHFLDPLKAAVSVPIWIDELACKGDESFVANCTFGKHPGEIPWGSHDCKTNHFEDVLVVCGAWNSCNPDPCLNDGFCVDGPASFTCYCPPGFFGHRCQISSEDLAPASRFTESERMSIFVLITMVAIWIVACSLATFCGFSSSMNDVERHPPPIIQALQAAPIHSSAEVDV